MKILVTLILVTISDNYGITNCQNWKGLQNPVGQLQTQEVLSSYQVHICLPCWSSLQRQIKLTLPAHGALEV